MKRLYALRGQSRSGKDTVAQMIIDAGGGVGRKLALAGPIKSYASSVFRFTPNQLYGPAHFRDLIDDRYVEKTSSDWQDVLARGGGREGIGWLQDVMSVCGVEKPFNIVWGELQTWLMKTWRDGKPTPRYVLQTLGTEFGRMIDEDIWLKYAWNTIQHSNEERHIVTDVRFFNEAQFFYMKGAEIWHILRPIATGESAMSAGVANHPSEMAQKNDDILRFDHVTIRNTGTLEDLGARVMDELAQR